MKHMLRRAKHETDIYLLCLKLATISDFNEKKTDWNQALFSSDLFVLHKKQSHEIRGCYRIKRKAASQALVEKEKVQLSAHELMDSDTQTHPTRGCFQQDPWMQKITWDENQWSLWDQSHCERLFCTHCSLVPCFSSMYNSIHFSDTHIMPA